MYDLYNGYYDNGAAVGVALVIGLVGLLLGLAFYVVSSIFLMKIFEKAGVEGKWRAWVPVYSVMVFFKLGDLSPWLVLYAFAGSLLLSWIGIGYAFSLALAVFAALAAWRVGLKLQKDAVWVILYVLLSLVWYGINAFDKSRWNPNVAPAPWAGNGFLGDKTVWQGIPVQPTPAAAPGYGAPQQGYGAPQQGYGAPQQGYAPPAQPGYAPPAQPGYAPPAAPQQAPGVPPTAPQVPPAAPQVPPAAPQAPPAPPAAPLAAPPAPPAGPSDPNQPPA